jgi:hypothetical protein
MNSIINDQNILTDVHRIIKAGARRLRNSKFFIVLSILLTLTTTLLLTPAIYSSMNSVVIKASGQISLPWITANSGSPEDVQAAVDEVVALGGGKVYVPEGNFIFNPNDAPSGEGVQIPGGVSVIGAGKDLTILQETRRVTGNIPMFKVDGSNDLPSRVSGFTFKGYVVDEVDGYSNTGVLMYNCKNYRVDHCKFTDFNHFGVSTSIYTSASKMENGEYQYYWNWGLIDHCDFDLPYKDTIGGNWGYGVGVFGPGRPDAWLYDLNDVLGKWNIETNPIRCALDDDPYGGKYFRWLVYIEDCTFSRNRHAIASNNEAFYVARHNTFTEARPKNYPNIDIHGAMGADWWGGRGAEVYNNTIYAAEDYGGSCAIDYRGGGGVVFDNSIINCQYGVRLSYEGSDTNSFCWVKDLWIWNNDYQNVAVLINDLYGIYQEENQYFLREKTGYTPYVYPHPLATE